MSEKCQYRTRAPRPSVPRFIVAGDVPDCWFVASNSTASLSQSSAIKARRRDVSSGFGSMLRCCRVSTTFGWTSNPPCPLISGLPKKGLIVGRSQARKMAGRRAKYGKD